MSRVKSPPLAGLRSDYEIAKQGGRFRRKRNGVSGVGTSGDYHFKNESSWLYSIEYARDLDRNDQVAGMVVDRFVDNILQESGITPDPASGDENADAFIRDMWWRWTSDEDACDLAGEMKFAQIERMVLRSALVDGDILPIGTDGGQLEIMESHRCRTPTNSRKNIVYGVELDQNRRRLSYYFTKDDISTNRVVRKVSDTVPVPARDEDGFRQVFHVFDPNRVSQTRGVSCFSRVADALGMHDDIQFANLVRQQIASCFAIIRKKKSAGGPLTSGGAYGEKTTESTSGYTRTLENISPGMEISTEPGEEIDGFSPDVPNPQFFEHVYLILKLISANLGIPLHAVLLDASQTNFSGWRGAHDQAKAGYRRVQNWLIDKFHQRVYEWKVRQWLVEYPELAAWGNQKGVDLTYCIWRRPGWDYIQPVQDVTADAAKVASWLSTLRRIHAAKGLEYDEIIPEGVRDNANLIRLCIEAARSLNENAQDDSERVTWRDVFALPGKINISMAASADPDQFGGAQNA